MLVADSFVNDNNKQRKKIKAIWDTGASMSCISQRVANELKLVMTGYVKVSGVNSVDTVPRYQIDVGLPNKMMIEGLNVSEAKTLGDEFDMLIGMDIIKFGTLALSWDGTDYLMSFVVPSPQNPIDFVKIINNNAAKLNTKSNSAGGSSPHKTSRRNR